MLWSWPSKLFKTTETVEIAVACGTLWHDTTRERRWIMLVVLPHTIRFTHDTRHLTRHSTHDTTRHNTTQLDTRHTTAHSPSTRPSVSLPPLAKNKASKQLEQLVEVCHEGSSSLRLTGQDHRAGWAAVGIAAPWSPSREDAPSGESSRRDRRASPSEQGEWAGRRDRRALLRTQRPCFVWSVECGRGGVKTEIERLFIVDRRCPYQSWS